jgi:hypothetical protein
MEPHDCILAKLVRSDEKDLNFAVALVRANLIDLDTRASMLPPTPPSAQPASDNQRG